MNFINNTTKDYSRDQLINFYEDEDEVSLYLDLLDPAKIKESMASNVIVETSDEKKCRVNLFSGL